MKRLLSLLVVLFAMSVSSEAAVKYELVDLGGAGWVLYKCCFGNQ